MSREEKKAYKKKNRAIKRKKRKELRAKRKVLKVAGFAARLIMTVRNVSGTYSLSDGTILPGYNEETRFLGMNSTTTPLTGFIFGQQGYDVLEEKMITVYQVWQHRIIGSYKMKI